MTVTRIMAVLTGDLVASRKAQATAVDAAMQQLANTAAALEGDTRFTRFRGDGWQIALTDPRRLMTAILLILADLRAADLGIDTRIAVGVGAVDSLGTTNLADAAGQAFVLSGQGLDDMPKQKRLAIAGGRAADMHWQLAIFELLDWMSGHWTAAQAQAVASALRHPKANHQMLADQLGITRQAMQSRLSKAGMNHLVHAILAFQDSNWDTAR